MNSKLPNDSPELIRMRTRVAAIVAVIGALLTLAIILLSPFRDREELLNIAYDGSREPFEELDDSFTDLHPGVRINTSHAGSVKQASNIIQGLNADVVTLATPPEVDAISSRTGLIDADWRDRFPHGSSPFTSTIVFLVRAGNPSGIDDWDDLTRRDIDVTIASPKTSGAGKLIYLAAWQHALEKAAGDEIAAKRFVARLYAKSPALDIGTREALHTFMTQDRYDVLPTWENEAWHALKEYGGAKVAIVYPTMSIKAEPVVVVVSGHTRRRETTADATAYVEFLFSESGQRILARHHLRPRNSRVATHPSLDGRAIRLIDVQADLGGWEEMERKHFAPGALFDKIYKFEQLKRHGF